jgi:hypothetical protein
MAASPGWGDEKKKKKKKKRKRKRRKKEHDALEDKRFLCVSVY